MIFRQLFDPLSCTYTYLLGCEHTRQAVLVDPVMASLERDLAELRALGLTLAYSVETHIHADHITAARELKRSTGSRIAAPACDQLPCVDFGIEEDRPLRAGEIFLRPLHTPGHTDGHFSYLLEDRVLTGDALLIDSCGRTDFQNGDADILYRSVTEKLFSLPDECLVYPGHDYHGKLVSSIGREKRHNPRLGGGIGPEQFRAIMANLDLPYPKLIDFALPGNRECGRLPSELPEELWPYCGKPAQSR